MAAVSGEYEVKSPASIKALPPKTVLQIASSQVLVDPGSVVKELIDNALDARATAIFVDITPNALDSIQVKDNGHGIPAQDRALVCRRHCTSKLCDFHQLSEIGGKWLGFRGEALASVANVSGSLRVVTRVEGEPVAVLLNFDQKGEVASCVAHF
jgi:DNA mismatch repair protein MutL